MLQLGAFLFNLETSARLSIHLPQLLEEMAPEK